MSRYNPKIHKRRSIRLKGYDYGQNGLYFITICIQNRECLLGDIVNGKLQTNDAGKMIDKWYFELENKFPNIKCHNHIVMPNHFHCIVEIVGAVGVVGANTQVWPNSQNDRTSSMDKSLMMGEHIGSPLHAVIQWFKTMTTNEYIRNVKSNDWKRFDGKLWQPNYWEHIIRNEKSYQNISEYIINNPTKWIADKLNPNNISK